MANPPKKVTIIGSGNWGSAIARIVGVNVQKFDCFDKTVRMYVFEEQVNGRKLTDIINTDHENVKYLPGFKFTNNVVAVPDILESARDADILVFVLPHQFIGASCKPLIGKIKSTAIGVSLIKGFNITPNKQIQLISELIHDMLNIEMGVLMGANLANEIAEEKFSETTIAFRDKATGKILKDLFQTDNFQCSVVNDIKVVEICGALKNIVACGAGFADGLKLGDNTKAAILRLGLKEMIKFAEVFYPGFQQITFFESCGVADLITTCYGGRNRRIAEAFVKTGKTIEQLEKELLNGQRTQGPQTAAEVYEYLEKSAKDKMKFFPLFVAIHRICQGEIPPSDLLNYARNHP